MLIPLTLAHSPDPDDVFMWWPITGKIDPRDPSRVVEPPVVDTGRFAFRALPADIDVLNRRAIGVGDLDITALSIFAWSGIADRYTLTCCGSSMGEGYGPKVVMRSAVPPTSALRGRCPDVPPTSALRGRCLRAQEAPTCSEQQVGGTRQQVGGITEVIAVPGVRTTAFLLLSLALGPGSFRNVEIPFDRILDTVASGRAEAGLLIHQSQLTFAELGLEQVLDLGRWWLDCTGLPLPLGGNAIRRDLEAQHGPGTLGEITAILDRSIRHALAHREESTQYAMRFAPEISRAQADRYIDMYVSDLTIDAGERGQAAIERLLAEAARIGLARSAGPVTLIRPG